MIGPRLKTTIAAMTDGNVALIVFEEESNKIVLNMSCPPEAARQMAEQIVQCADMADAAKKTLQ